MSCFYCEKGEKLDSFTIKIGELGVSTLYLQKEQSYYGRCLLVYKRHVEEVFELDKTEWCAFMEDAHTVTGAMSKLYMPDKINVGMFGDTVRHLHAHVVPKRTGELDWNSIFQLNANKTFLSEEEYAQMVAAYRDCLDL